MSHARTATVQKRPQSKCVKIYKLPQEGKDEMRLEPFKRKQKKFSRDLNDDHGMMRYQWHHVKNGTVTK